ncbi:MAG: hypothetical protein IKH56_10090 [Oscillospiraceae bacterium]|nr:hypothetical protein [Oscillospiraceae bacterium]
MEKQRPVERRPGAAFAAGSVPVVEVEVVFPLHDVGVDHQGVPGRIDGRIRVLEKVSRQEP